MITPIAGTSIAASPSTAANVLESDSSYDYTKQRVDEVSKRLSCSLDEVRASP